MFLLNFSFFFYYIIIIFQRGKSHERFLMKIAYTNGYGKIGTKYTRVIWLYAIESRYKCNPFIHHILGSNVIQSEINVQWRLIVWCRNREKCETLKIVINRTTNKKSFKIINVAVLFNHRGFDSLPFIGSTSSIGWFIVNNVIGLFVYVLICISTSSFFFAPNFSLGSFFSSCFF